MDQVLRAIESRYGRGSGRRHVLVLKSEGVKLDSARLKEMVDARIGGRLPGVDTRVVVLGHVVRGGAPSALDRMLASRLCNVAVRAVHAGQSGVMAGWTQPGQTRPATPEDPHVTLWSLDEVLAETARMHSGEADMVRWRVRAFSEVEAALLL